MSQLARKRWRLLGDILCNRGVFKSKDLSSVSVRRFVSFGLFKTKRVVPDSEKGALSTYDSEVNEKIILQSDEANGLTDSKSFKSALGENDEGHLNFVNNLDAARYDFCDIHLNDVVSNSDTKFVNDIQGNGEEGGGKSSPRRRGSTEESNVTTDCSQTCDVWFTYTSDYFPRVSLDIRHLDSLITFEDLLGFNNTGNVCVWPSEEVLAYYCQRHSYLFTDASVCELGGGMTCLAAFTLAVTARARNILATDGNISSVSNLRQILDKNQAQFNAQTIEARLVRWDDEDCLSCSLVGQFDFIICADCLFFDEYRRPLLRTIGRLLKSGGRAILFAPSRGDTFDKFVELVSGSSDIFEISALTDNYDDVIYRLHCQNLSKGVECYDESLHYPRLLTFSRK